MIRLISRMAVATAVLAFSSTFASAAGDCDGNGIVTIAEVQAAINMYQGRKAVALCVNTDGSVDANGVGIVTSAKVQRVIDTYLGLIPVYDGGISATEGASTLDNPGVYAVETTANVINASIITYDNYSPWMYTMDEVYNDTDPDDSFVPEVAAHFVADNYADDHLPDNATLRQRGSSSRLAVQKSYRVKLMKTLPLWRGETTLQLNKHPWDLTRVRNKLAFDLFREIPHLPSLRTQFMHVTVNSQDFGLFTHVEKRGKEYLTNRGLPTDGTIYKANDFNFSNNSALAVNPDGTIDPANLTAFELVLELDNDNKNHLLLPQMLTAVNDENQDFEATFRTYFDKSNYLTWLAVNILVGNHDTINQNFGLYQPKGTTKYYFLPWDYDGAFGFENQPDVAARNSLYASWQLELSNWWGSPLHRRFMQNPEHLIEIRQAVEEIYSKYLTEAKLKTKLDFYKPLVQPLIMQAPDFNDLPNSTPDKQSEWNGEYERLKTTVKTNYDRFKAALEKPMPFWQSATVVGEQLQLAWDRSYDLQGDPVTYSILLANNPDFTNPIENVNGQSGLGFSRGKPSPGTYYLRVTARDSKGNTQEAFDRTDIDLDPDPDQVNIKSYFGVLQFVVQ